jgi:hypothetical protein
MVDSLLSLLDGFENIVMAVLDLISLLDAVDIVLNTILSTRSLRKVSQFCQRF